MHELIKLEDSSVGFVVQEYCRGEIGFSVAFLVTAELDEPATEYTALFEEETVKWMCFVVHYGHKLL